MTFPIDLVSPIRARDLVQRVRSLDELAALTGMTQGAIAFVPSYGFYRAEVGPTWSLSRASSGRSPLGFFKNLGPDLPRFASPTRIFEAPPAGGTGAALAMEGGLLIEPSRTNRVTQAAGAPAGTYNPDAGSGVTGTSVGLTDPILGSFRRIQKTAGPVASRFGAYVGGGSLSGPSFVTAALVRPWSAVGRAALYTDAVRAAGLITTSIFVNLADLPFGEWSLLRCVGRVGGSVLSGTFSTYFWLDNGVGGLADFALVTTTSGGAGVVNLEAPFSNLSSVNTEAPLLTPSKPIDFTSGAVVVRGPKSLLHAAVVATDAYPARVLWQARSVGGDGLRLAWEPDATLKLTMTSGATVTTVSVLASTISSGQRGIGARWSRDDGLLALTVDGAVVAMATSLAPAAFPSGGTSDLLVGHGGSGAESLQGVVAWLAAFGRDPGEAELNAATVSLNPRGGASQVWDFRAGASPTPLSLENRPEVVVGAEVGVAWRQDVAANRQAEAQGLLDYLAW